jgi:hypothetical protein
MRGMGGRGRVYREGEAGSRGVERARGHVTKELLPFDQTDEGRIAKLLRDLRVLRAQRWLAN